MLIGYGAMAQAVIERLPEGVTIGWIVARTHHHAAIRTRFGDRARPLLLPQDCAETPDLVLECASQQAVAQYGEAVLHRGWHRRLSRPARWRTAHWSNGCGMQTGG